MDNGILMPFISDVLLGYVLAGSFVLYRSARRWQRWQESAGDGA